MNTVVPAVIPKSRDDLESTLTLVETFTTSVQVDVVDGVFVPHTSWPYGAGEAIADIAPWCESMEIELDLMIQEPELHLAAWLATKPQRVVIHLESVRNLGLVFELCAQSSTKLGISILNTTPLEQLLHIIDQIDYVQLMGIREIGVQGQPFDSEVLERVTTLTAAYPDIEVSIDGSVNADTLTRLRAVGASRFVSGSAILKAPNPAAAYESLTAL